MSIKNVIGLAGEDITDEYIMQKLSDAMRRNEAEVILQAGGRRVSLLITHVNPQGISK